ALLRLLPPTAVLAPVINNPTVPPEMDVPPLTPSVCRLVRPSTFIPLVTLPVTDKPFTFTVEAAPGPPARKLVPPIGLKFRLSVRKTPAKLELLIELVAPSVTGLLVGALKT